LAALISSKPHLNLQRRPVLPKIYSQQVNLDASAHLAFIRSVRKTGHFYGYPVQTEYHCGYL
jgi:hypothetical protein